jgi:hypothetical protein
MDDKRRLSRRSLLRSAALLASGTLAGSIVSIKPAYAQKASKVDAKYQDSPKDGQKCDQCVYFQAPNKCGVVEGDISPNGWSAMFNKK